MTDEATRMRPVSSTATLSTILLGACTALVLLAAFRPPVSAVPMSRTSERDLRGRFREIFCAVAKDHGARLQHPRPCARALKAYRDEPPASGMPVAIGRPAMPIHVVIVPGIFGECFNAISRPFQVAAAHLRARHGYRVTILDVSGRSSSRGNARQIARQLSGSSRTPGERLIVIGYSKGATDVIETLTRFPDAIGHGAAIVSLAGVVAGTPIAEQGAGVYRSLLRDLRLDACPPGDGGGVESLLYRTRRAWARAHPLPRHYRYYSLPAITDRANTSRAMITTRRTLDRIDTRNDGQILYRDALIPGGSLLGYANADHWAVTLDFTRHAPAWMRPLTNRNAYPREVLLEAIVRTIEEDFADADRRAI